MSAAAELAPLVESLAEAKVLVIGDVMLDRFIAGQVERISPEAPIPILKVTRESTMLGGAGNVVRNLAALGARPTFLAVVGSDAAGAEIQKLVAELAGGEMLIDKARPSTIKERFIAGAQQLLRVDREAPAALSPELAQRLLSSATAAMAGAKVLVLSDYGKGVLGREILKPLIAAAKERGLAIVVDPKDPDYAAYAGASFVTPNRRELSEASGRKIAGNDSVVAAARDLMRRHSLGGMLATRSEEGMTLIEEKAVHHLPAQAREVFDVSGAGDTVVAVMAAALAVGLGSLAAARLANAAAGLVVGKVGTAVIRPEELRQALLQQEQASNENKVLDQSALVERVAKWRRAGLKVGFANGCFDLLHPGHVSLLAKARAACDRLIVAINSDPSVKRLKGPSRPVQTEAARAQVLASLAAVDAVTSFDDDTPLSLISAVKPDLLIKGADYAHSQVVGAKEVESWGGRVYLVPLEPGHSTSQTIKKINA